MEKKSILKSKTFWANLIAIAILCIEYFAGVDIGVPIEAQGGVLALANIALRAFFTNKGIKIK